MAQRNAKYAMLSDDEDDFAPAMPAPTTAPLPKASKKNLRKAKVCICMDWARQRVCACSAASGMTSCSASIEERDTYDSTFCMLLILHV